jgi:hypothetical protein
MSLALWSKTKTALALAMFTWWLQAAVVAASTAHRRPVLEAANRV